MNVYLDNGATTKVAEEVAEAMQPYFTEHYGNASSIHSLGLEAKTALENARESIAKKINAKPSEIIFTSGGTESDNLAIRGFAYANKEKGNHIITSVIEHPAVLNTCKDLEKDGFKVSYLSVDKEGFVDLKQLEKEITDKTTLVSIMHSNNEIGTIQPIKEIAEICAKKGVVFHTDAVQSFTKFPIDVKKDGIAMASFSAHKIHGPKGVGALFVKEGIKLKPLFTGGSQEGRKRAGTENVAGIVGFAKAVELVEEKELKKMQQLRDYLIKRIIEEIPEVQLNGSSVKRLCNNANFSFHFIEGEGLLTLLNLKGVCVSTGSACSSHTLEPSHVLLAIGLTHEVAHGSIRFTLSRYNTQKEIDYAIDCAKEAVQKLRAMSPLAKGEK